MIARLLRALSGKSQEQLGKEVGVSPSLIAQFETGKVLPSREHLELLAEGAGLTLREAQDVLSLCEALRRSHRRRGGRSAEDLFQALAEDVRAHAESVYRRVLTLPLPVSHPRAEDRQRAEALGPRLKDLPPELSSAMVQIAEEFQSWALCEWLCVESVREASRHWQGSAGLARLAGEIAERVSGPEGWRNRLRGYSAAHAANSLRVSGELNAAEVVFEEAKGLWHSGADPASLLEPGCLLDLEASLRRDQRRFGEALALLDEAAAVGASPARILIKKGFTLEVKGDYERAVETLLQAKPLVESQADPRLLYMMRFNLAVNSCHLGLYAEAAGLVRQVREAALERSDENELTRVLWLEGRIAAGLGRISEVRSLLEQARRKFEQRAMVADAALTLLEEAILLLRDGQTAEAKVLARGLTGVLESKGLHREAMTAMRLF